MTLSVRDLTRMPHLRTRIHAGAAGADRLVAWAHSSEVPNPWEWLEPGDLLMTVGLGVPDGPEAQAAWVERLAEASVSGVAIGEEMHAPPLTDAMRAAADRCELPLLLTATEIPFIELSRAVAAANHGREQQRLAETARLYERMRAGVAHGDDAVTLLRNLGEELGCRLHALDAVRLTPVFSGAERLADTVRTALAGSAAAVPGTDAVATPGAAAAGAGAGAAGTSPAASGASAAARATPASGAAAAAARPELVRVQAGDATVLAVPLATRMPALLAAVAEDGAEPPPYALLQHAATIVAMEVERLAGARAEQRRIGSEVLANLLDAEIAPAAAAYALRWLGLSEPPLTLIAAADGAAHAPGGSRATGATASPPAVGRATVPLHRELIVRGVPSLVLDRDDATLFLVGGGEAAVAAAVELLAAEQRHVGVSDPFHAPEDAPSALRQARWAIEAGRADGRAVARYGEERASFGPRSVGEARQLADHVLGELIAYDAAHGTELVRTLDVFLRRNRSWQQAARELVVHKQTLVYRVRRAEEITGRRLDRTADVSALWIALRARETAA